MEIKLTKEQFESLNLGHPTWKHWSKLKFYVEGGTDFFVTETYRIHYILIAATIFPLIILKDGIYTAISELKYLIKNEPFKYTFITRSIKIIEKLRELNVI